MLFKALLDNFRRFKVVIGDWHGVHKPVELQVASIIRGCTKMLHGEANQDLRLRTVLNWERHDKLAGYWMQDPSERKRTLACADSLMLSNDERCAVPER
jgi:hypothetical protein